MNAMTCSRHRRIGMLAALALVLAASLLPAPAEAKLVLRKTRLGFLSSNASNQGLSLSGETADTLYAALGPASAVDSTTIWNCQKAVIPFGQAGTDSSLIARVVIVSDSSYTASATAVSVVPQIIYSSELAGGAPIVKSLPAITATCASGDKIISFPLLYESTSIPMSFNAFGNGAFGVPGIRFLSGNVTGGGFGHAHYEVWWWEDVPY